MIKPGAFFLLALIAVAALACITASAPRFWRVVWFLITLLIAAWLGYRIGLYFLKGIPL